MKYTKEVLGFIKEARDEGQKWSEISVGIEEEFGEVVSKDSLRMSYKYNSLKLELGTDEVDLLSLRRERSARKASTVANKRLRIALDEIDVMEDFTQQVIKGFDTIVEELSEVPVRDRKSVPSHKDGTPMTMELLISDTHFGKKTDSFNEVIARDRVDQIASTVLKEIKFHSTKFNVEKLVILLGGDIIESATMHKEESRAGCEYGNARQVTTAIDILTKHLIIPVSQSGIPIDVLAIPGNHDRETTYKTYVNRGEEFLSHIIYNGIKSITDALGLDVTYQITDGTFIVYDIYGSKVLYEHGDEIKGTDRRSFETHIAKRQKQLGCLIDFIRSGHIHEYTMYDRGRSIINGCLCGADGYSDIHGFNTHAIQVLNFYCPSDRPTSFYKTFGIYLD